MIIRFTPPRFALAAVLAASLFQAPLPAAAQAKSDTADSLFPDPVVASGKGFEIRRSVLDEAFINYQSEMARQQRRVPEAARAEFESNALEHIIVIKIEAQKATDEEKAMVTDKVSKSLEEFRKSAPSEAAYQAKLKSLGLTLDQLKARGIEEQLGQTVLTRELVSSNVYSDEAVKKFYDSNPKRWVIPDRVRIAQILISTIDPLTRNALAPEQKAAKRKLAEEVLAQATNNGDFAKLAAQYSDDASTKNAGGEYPPFARGQIALDLEPIEAAAFTLKTNQVSDLVETKLGYHIIKLLEVLPPSTMALTNVAPLIKGYLTDTELKNQLPAFVPKIEAEYGVKISNLDSATPAMAPPSSPANDLLGPAKK